MSHTELSELEIERYARQLILSSWSSSKQVALKHYSVAIPNSLFSAAYYLSALGIGEIEIYGIEQPASEMFLGIKKLNPLTALRLTQAIQWQGRPRGAVLLLQPDNMSQDLFAIAQNLDFLIGVSVRSLQIETYLLSKQSGDELRRNVTRTGSISSSFLAGLLAAAQVTNQLEAVLPA